MKHLVYKYNGLSDLQAFYRDNVDDGQRVVLQLHTATEENIDEIYALMTNQKSELHLIPIIEEGVDTTLHFDIYPQRATVVQKETFLEHDLYKMIIDSTKEGFWLLDEELNIISINRSLAMMFGYTEAELLGKKPYEMLALVDEQQKLCENKAQEVYSTIQRTYELTFVTKEQRTFHTIVNATTLYLPENRTRTFAFITDINKQKELEQTLIRQQHEINALNSDLTLRIEREVKENQQKDRIMYQQARLATMGEMIGNIAHQWRQPLNIMALIMQDFYISGQLGTLDDEKLEKEYARANTVLQYMSSTIDDFRTFFKHNEEGEVFSINSAINSVIALVSKGLEHNKITIDVAVDEEIAVFGYRNEFVQALINIINNAREAVITNADEGFIHIGVETDDSNVYIQVNDNGGGINDKAIDKIFEPYFTTKHKTQGTGLGLYMTHQIIVGNMNGSIMVENRGEGTSFKITLPKEQSL